MTPLRFNDALRRAAAATRNDALPAQPPVRIIRDIYGRLRFAINAGEADYPAEARSSLEAAQQTLGAYSGGDELLFRDSFADPDRIFNSSDWHTTVVAMGVDEDGNSLGEVDVMLLDRQITGQDWIRTTRAPRPDSAPPRVVFYGLKGGVGRSTALCMLAYSLAREGKRVLLLDFDLESPGLSGLLLPSDRVAGFGLVDWFIEDAVQRDDSVLLDLVSDSPLAELTRGQIRVAAAMGQGENAYLAKLARVYADVPSPTGPERFAQRMARLVAALEAQERPDIVLIDSRAGLHDLAAISIAGLADLALLFATDSEQNWQGYRQLFEHWRQRPEVLRGVRERLWMVRAMFPESDQEARFQRFLERSYDLFADHLYDEIQPTRADDEPPDAGASEPFSFPMDSDAAPHFPWTVRWSPRFVEFDALSLRNRGGVDDTDIDLAFGPFVERVKESIFGE
ncbi:tyrosine-protein kinase family protein [Sphaerotilus microaerophilus]|uniref:CobQ/CobB/MinD/ParA nucleotide binding domain-containing protein n=1 Tax=Sphaerotilus microaerophilus TaxID=2914710 RepID=A0ABN6PQK4_9BURK|nr:AAA family ATPase [Sphaerotilus sp. FB-5]BDI06352.1 hypothetical protein CATMQ487_33220 [Sphaerotilus sp. FB-5]